MAGSLPFRFRRIGVAVAATATTLSCGSCSPTSMAEAVRSEAGRYCAIMPDSVGLYVDNPVTQMGYPIGKIAAITPEAMSVRVDFTVDDGRVLPENVKAVTRSASILADRSLELVGNYEAGPRLSAGGCIPLSRSLTPKSLSEVVGASTTFINSINPAGSDNVGAVVGGVDRALHGQGAGANNLLTTTSAVVDSPEQTLGDLDSITTNLAQVTTTLADLNPTLKEVFVDASNSVLQEAIKTTVGAANTFDGVIPVTDMASGLEKELGPQIQQLLDAVSVAVRKATPRAPYYASLLNVAPRLLNGFINVANNHQFTLHYRPPTYRLRAPEGVAQCNIMNAAMPGSCANVKGTPYAVDVALLQYVLAQAASK
ncbi:phospholipid/cholesterol/gamma-HCH transport system substrate-binding protein [Mycobacterium sp. MAA66]|uniref:MlaD family protein n=1 Tax=Mycobacterium sp. MAA66 TaxID=3156297 RepID=UPI0035135A7E